MGGACQGVWIDGTRLGVCVDEWSMSRCVSGACLGVCVEHVWV